MTKKKSGNIDLSELLSDLKKSFIADVPVRLDEMESLILTMEQGDHFNDNYETLYRHAHSLKGSAGSYGLHIITNVCHAFEDVLNEVGRDKKYFNKYGADYWLQYIDLMRKLLDGLNSGSSNFTEIENQLKELQSTTSGGTSFELYCLVVTSSSLYENLLPSSLDTENIKFAFCNNGYEALGRLLTESFDLLISDHEVPLLNGPALFGCLKLSNSRNNHIKTILLTSKKLDSSSCDLTPDYVINKDKDFSNNLSAAIRDVAQELSSLA